jgi:hypothetical protein
MAATWLPTVADEILPVWRWLNECEGIHPTKHVQIDKNLDNGGLL